MWGYSPGATTFDTEATQRCWGVFLLHSPAPLLRSSPLLSGWIHLSTTVGMPKSLTPPWRLGIFTCLTTHLCSFGRTFACHSLASASCEADLAVSYGWRHRPRREPLIPIDPSPAGHTSARYQRGVSQAADPARGGRSNKYCEKLLGSLSSRWQLQPTRQSAKRQTGSLRYEIGPILIRASSAATCLVPIFDRKDEVCSSLLERWNNPSHLTRTCSRSSCVPVVMTRKFPPVPDQLAVVHLSNFAKLTSEEVGSPSIPCFGSTSRWTTSP